MSVSKPIYIKNHNNNDSVLLDKLASTENRTRLYQINKTGRG